MPSSPELRFTLAGALGGALVRGLFLSTRVQAEGTEHYLRFRRQGQPVVFVFWHGQLLPLLHRHREEGIVVLVSEHADGEYVTRIIERLGFGTARGSSTRGGTRGLRSLMRAARAGHDLAVTPDGPRGPARVLKPGALVAARALGLPIIPVAAGANSAWHTDSWDGFLIPRPLARLRLLYGPPQYIPRDGGDEDLGRLAETLQHTLNEMSVAVGTNATPRTSSAGTAPP
jgi:lysophospholipid acyltransferase (LPLAT)-like uncharacterized protein